MARLCISTMYISVGVDPDPALGQLRCPPAGARLWTFCTRWFAATTPQRCAALTLLHFPVASSFFFAVCWLGVAAAASAAGVYLSLLRLRAVHRDGRPPHRDFGAMEGHRLAPPDARRADVALDDIRADLRLPTGIYCKGGGQRCTAVVS